jgi:hypothetical protein
MIRKLEVKALTQKKDFYSRSELVWNPQSHMRLIHEKRKNLLDNQQLVAEGF